jgi:hypothetical protein
MPRKRPRREALEGGQRLDPAGQWRQQWHTWMQGVLGNALWAATRQDPTPEQLQAEVVHVAIVARGDAARLEPGDDAAARLIRATFERAVQLVRGEAPVPAMVKNGAA